MDKKEQILHYHRIDGLSQREIARRVGVSRKTVKRYITEYDTLAQSDPEEGINMCLASEPKYPTRKIERTRLTEPVCAEIEYWLSENAKRRLTGMRKQCLKKQDIHRALIEKGFTISYSSVCKYIQQRKAEKSRKPKDVFVKQYYEPGEECEFDWGEVKLSINGKQRQRGVEDILHGRLYTVEAPHPQLLLRQTDQHPAPCLQQLSHDNP